MLKFSPKAEVFQSVVFKRKSRHQALPCKWTGNLALLPTYYLPSEVELMTGLLPRRRRGRGTTLKNGTDQLSPEASALPVSEHEETTSYLHLFPNLENFLFIAVV